MNPAASGPIARLYEFLQDTSLGTQAGCLLYLAGNYNPDGPNCGVGRRLPNLAHELECLQQAATAICAEQYPDGQFSTWGRDYQTGKSLNDETDPPRKNWFNGNAFADWALYKLTLYCRTPNK